MIRVPISKLEQGMVLATPVWHPGVEDHVLLRADFSLDAECIGHLKRIGVEAVWVRHPGFEFLDQKLPDDIPRRRVRVYESVKRSFSAIADRTSGAFDLLEYRTIVGELILTLVANRNNAVWAQRLMDAGDELFAHCANVAYLSLVIGMRVKHYVAAQRSYVCQADAADLTNLGIGAMLHDLGKLGLDPEWRDVHFMDQGAISDEYRSHAERGYRAVQGRVEATASQVLLHHHQRFDGHGFPELEPVSEQRQAKPMVGTNIHIFSRIVAVANAVDVLINVSKKRGLPLVTALAEIQQPTFDGMLDPVVLDAALRVIPPFPLGAYVELSDGRHAVVTDLNESRPCQPKVHVLGPNPDVRGEGCEELDLSASDAPSIVKTDNQAVPPKALYVLPERPVEQDAALRPV